MEDRKLTPEEIEAFEKMAHKLAAIREKVEKNHQESMKAFSEMHEKIKALKDYLKDKG